MKKRMMLVVSVLLIFSMLLTACGGNAAPAPATSEPAASEPAATEAKVLKLGHIAAPDTAYDNFAKEFARMVEERSEGRYTIDVYPAGQLGVDIVVQIVAISL